MQKPPPLPGSAVVPKRRSRAWRWVVRGLIALPVLGLLAVLTFYVVENVRGGRAWAKCRRELIAQGESLEAARVNTNAPLAEEENFFNAPLAEAWFCGGGGARGKPLPGPGGRSISVGGWQFGWQQAVPARVAEWQQMFVVEPPRQPRVAARRGGPAEPRGPDTNAPSAAQVLESLAPHATNLTELARLLAERPRGRFSTDETGLASGQRAGFGNFTTVAAALSLRAGAHLALSNSAAAFEDVMTMLRLADTLAGDPCLVPALVRAGLIAQAIQPVWEGCAAGRWNDAQLAGLQRAFSACDVAGDVAQAMRRDRALVLGLLEESPAKAFAHASINEWGWSGGDEGRFFNFLFTVAPDGWLDQNRAVFCATAQDRLAHLDAARREPPARDEPLPEAEQWWRRRPNPYNLLAMLAAQTTFRASTVGLNTQHAIGLVTVGCGVERHRLAAGTLPENLAQLVPGYLERLPAGGQAVVYERGEKGRFVLSAAERKDNFGFEQLPDNEGRRNRPAWRFPQRR